MVAVVEPSKQLRERRFTTPLTPLSQTTSASVFRANMVQNFLDGRAAHSLAAWQNFLLVMVSAMIAVLALRSVDAKRVVLFVIGIGAILVMGAGWLALTIISAVLPVSAMLGALLVSAATMVLLREHSQDDRLKSVLERAIGFSYSRSILNEQAHLSHFVTAAARNLAIDNSAVFQFRGDGEPLYKENFGFTPHEMPDEKTLRLLSKRTKRTGTVIDVSNKISSRTETSHYITRLDNADVPTFWFFSVNESGDPAALKRITDQAQDIAKTYARFYRWRADLSASDSHARRFQPIDRQIASAASLISTQSEQMREGIEHLNTAVAIYHVGGFPVHANAAMQNLYGDAELNLARASLSEALLTLTTLEEEAVQLLIHDLIVSGREVRVPAREFTAKQRILRIATHRDETPDKGWLNLIILEALDISELNKLANLRHAVGNFVDKQLRNDLEALEFGADVALSHAAEMPGLTKVLNRIRDVSQRATGRLDQVASLLDDASGTNLEVCYPIDARKVVEDAFERVRNKAEDFEVDVALDLPGISGFTMAEPQVLLETIEAMMNVVIADTPHGGSMRVSLHEERDSSRLEVTGGIGIPFERLIAAFDAGQSEVPDEFHAISIGIANAITWKGQVSYWSSVGKGYRFVIKLRRVG